MVFVDDGMVYLVGLVVFWQVGVEVVFVGEYVLLVDLCVDCQVEQVGYVYGFFVEYWQGVWYGQVDQVGLGIWCGVEGG